MEPVRIGIIGTGLMGQEHIRNFQLLAEAEVVALADTDAGMLNAARDLTGGSAAVHTDYRRLLADNRVEAIVIATPNHHHAAVLPAVMEAGKPLLCEKPLCTTVEDAKAMADRAADYPEAFQVGMEYRFKPALAAMIQRLGEGAAGDLVMLAIREHRFPFLPKIGNWNRFNRNTGGTLVEKCCHFFDLMRLICGGEPIRVYASAGQDVNHLEERYAGQRPDILDNALVVFDFEGGKRALLDLCMFAEASRHSEEFTATGSRGKVECLLPQNLVCIGSRETGTMIEEQIEVDREILEAGHHSGATYHQDLAFCRAVRGEGPVIVTAEDGYRAVAMGAAAQRSAAEGRAVLMSEAPIDPPAS